MKKEYLKPSVGVIILSDIMQAAPLENSGVADNPMAKETAEIEEIEVETGVPTKFTNIWDDEE